MLADFFTKPLQGSLFQKMRDIVQGFQTVDILEPEEKEEADENKCNEHNDVAN